MGVNYSRCSNYFAVWAFRVRGVVNRMWRVLWLALLVCSERSASAVFPLDLRSDAVRVSATAECGADADGRPLPMAYRVCRGGGAQCERICSASGTNGSVAHGVELAVDGDRNTSWQSPPLSHYLATGEGARGENLTVQFGEVRTQHFTSFTSYNVIDRYLFCIWVYTQAVCYTLNGIASYISKILNHYF